mmetsp:Transcript_73689/g.238179  ORF Transcript_73689/g.238179 Transcript_73689/m.238179 type:complete len:96 (+) Transcript_73689:1919-2206(+)
MLARCSEAHRGLFLTGLSLASEAVQDPHALSKDRQCWRLTAACLAAPRPVKPNEHACCAGAHIHIYVPRVWLWKSVSFARFHPPGDISMTVKKAL